MATTKTTNYYWTPTTFLLTERRRLLFNPNLAPWHSATFLEETHRRQWLFQTFVVFHWKRLLTRSYCEMDFNLSTLGFTFQRRKESEANQFRCTKPHFQGSHLILFSYSPWSMALSEGREKRSNQSIITHKFVFHRTVLFTTVFISYIKFCTTLSDKKCFFNKN